MRTAAKQKRTKRGKERCFESHAPYRSDFSASLCNFQSTSPLFSHIHRCLSAIRDRLVVKFAEYKGKLNGLPSLTSLTSAPLAAKHAAQPGDLKFAKLTTIADDIAKALATHKGKLDLSGVQSLSAEAAKALAGHKGELKLDGVKEISDEVAKALALAVGAVSLGSLEKASPAAAAVLKTNTKILLPAKLK